ncbi:hypothetical protein [Salinispora vitiensis]|uniref:hypothetical protein n=1 Tax=Salinispora vitiensis TaxID=999544 RepID=UPI000377DE94|nr:hypothetical protein [Salinispora vitiensis]
MARYWFGGGPADWTFNGVSADAVPDLAQLQGGLVCTFYNAEAGGTQYTDLLDPNGQPTLQILSEDGSGLRSKGQIPAFRGPDGVTQMWAECDGGPRVLMVTTDAADVVAVPRTILPPLSQIGDVTVGAGRHRLYNDSGYNLLISGVRASVGTPPTGSVSIRIDVNRNGTTIFSNQSARPAIIDGQSTSGFVTAIDVVTWDTGDYLTVDVDSVGSTTAGADLTVQVAVEKA